MIREDINVGAFVFEIVSKLIEGRIVSCLDLTRLFKKGFSLDDGFRENLAYVTGLISRGEGMKGREVRTTTHQGSNGLVVTFTLDRTLGEIVHNCVNPEDPDSRLNRPLPATYFVKAGNY